MENIDPGKYNVPPCPEVQDEELLAVFAAIRADLEHARTVHLEEPEAYLAILPGIIERLVSFREAVIDKMASPEFEVHTRLIDQDITELMRERVELASFLYGRGSSEHAKAVATWYGMDFSGIADDYVVPAIKYSKSASESHWECIRLLAMKQKNIRYCVAAYFLAKDHGRTKLAEACEARLRQCSRVFKIIGTNPLPPSNIHVPEPEVQKVEVPSLHSHDTNTSDESSANRLKAPVLEMARKSRHPKLLLDDAPMSFGDMFLEEYGGVGRGIGCWELPAS